MDQASASPVASCAHNPAAPRILPSWLPSEGQARTVVPSRDGSAPQSVPHSEPVHIVPRPSSPALCQSDAKGYLLLDYYSGATGIPGRFSEGLLLRRLQVRPAHLANERAQLSRDLRSANMVARSPVPIRSKPSTVPANDRFRPDNRNGANDGGEPVIKPNRKRSVLLRCGCFGARRRSTLICCRRIKISASSVARDLKSEARTPRISLNRSFIRSELKPKVVETFDNVADTYKRLRRLQDQDIQF